MRVTISRLASVAVRLKSEPVRELGMKLGIPENLVWRHPFPVRHFLISNTPLLIMFWEPEIFSAS